MTITQQVAMSDEEIYEFLANHQTAVLSVKKGPYAVPITYRFDPETETYYFRLVFPRRSEKRAFLPEVPACWLVSYVEDDPVYQSVIGKGNPTEVREEDITPEHVVQLSKTSRPLFEMWRPSRADVDIRLYEMAAEELSGRRIELEAHE
jgi:nitroimidazol reductase NimA-like FMN-containing flavoprotein (pyridoxamine 5'-phosphate oxidase superfamily)